ncbi:MAG: response regulator transcription factor [Burkholderiales bacterium]|nr:response regulator transcription factor [Burkholderiales bacterium]
MRILLVEDDPMIGEAVREGLRLEGYAVDWVRDGRAAESALATEAFAAVLLDLGLPKKDGMALLRSLRERKASVPVLVITARDTVADRVAGLDAGADDYLVKPFDLDELAARVRALVRRAAGRPEPLITRGAITINPATREVTVAGKPVPLSAREYALLMALAERPGIVLSRGQIENRIYGWGEEVGSNAVEVHVHNLRRKLGEDAIRTVRGVGYTLAPNTRA